MTAEEFLKKWTPWRPTDKFDREYGIFSWDSMIDFAEQYHEAKTKAEDKELLCSFFKYFRDNGEDKIGMSIEEFVNEFLNAHEK